MYTKRSYWRHKTYFTFCLHASPACSCNEDGSVDQECNRVTGQCNCKTNVTGRNCSMCKVRSFLPTYPLESRLSSRISRGFLKKNCFLRSLGNKSWICFSPKARGDGPRLRPEFTGPVNSCKVRAEQKQALSDRKCKENKIRWCSWGRDSKWPSSLTASLFQVEPRWLGTFRCPGPHANASAWKWKLFHFLLWRLRLLCISCVYFPMFAFSSTCSLVLHMWTANARKIRYACAVEVIIQNGRRIWRHRALVAQLVEHRAAMREVVSLNSARPTLRVLK